MAKCSIIPLLVISAVLLLLQNVYCKVIGDFRNEEEISFYLEGGNTVRSLNVGKGNQRLMGEYETESQTMEDTNEKHYIKQQVYSFQKRKHSDVRSQADTTTARFDSNKTRNTTERHQLHPTMTIRKLLPATTIRRVRDPSLRSRREENADDPSQVGDDPDVQAIPSVHGKDHDKKLSNYEWGFNSTDVLPGPFNAFFKFIAETNQGQPWGSSSMSWYPPQIGPQQWNPQQWWSYGQSQGAVPGQGNTGLYQEMRELE